MSCDFHLEIIFSVVALLGSFKVVSCNCCLDIFFTVVAF